MFHPILHIISVYYVAEAAAVILISPIFIVGFVFSLRSVFMVKRALGCLLKFYYLLQW